ncbi:MAG: PDR/VanB family oxidoreductase [Asticcacaulis sp.]
MIEIEVTDITDETALIRRFELRAVNGAALPAFGAGSHIDVHITDSLVRQYSLSNAPSETHRYVIGVLKEAVSRGGSKAMHDQITVGTRLRISEPRNLFPLASEAQKSLLIAGGIGITPILSMAEDLWARSAPFELHYYARARDMAGFLERLSQAPYAASVHLHFDAEPDTQYPVSDLVKAPQTGTHLYVCGPDAFMNHVLDASRAAGWAEADLHREYFTPQTQSLADDGWFKIRINSTGQEFDVEPDQTVAQAMEANGVFISLSCEQGICGTCLTGVIEGVPDHRDQYLTEEEQASNTQFTPCCSRAKSPLLILDL